MLFGKLLNPKKRKLMNITNERGALVSYGFPSVYTIGGVLILFGIVFSGHRVERQGFQSTGDIGFDYIFNSFFFHLCVR